MCQKTSDPSPRDNHPFKVFKASTGEMNAALRDESTKNETPARAKYEQHHWTLVTLGVTTGS
jgi:hypothetical protein